MTLRRAVAWALVAAAAVLLVAGLARGSGVRWFWLSALASAAAVAVMAVRRTEPIAGLDDDDEEKDEDEDEDEDDEPAPVSAGDLVALPEPVLLGQLPDLDLDQLEELYEREQLGPNRRAVLDRIEELATFPIVDYDQLDADEIVPLLDQLEPEELELVRDREEAGAARAEVLDEVGRLLEEEGPTSRSR